MARITAKNMTEAWSIANQIFPTDYEKDFGSSERAGYDIYRSTAEGHYYDYICNLGDRLELNLSNGKTVNVWIEREEEQTVEHTEEVKEEAKVADESRIAVEVTTRKTGTVKVYDEYENFINDLRLFMSGGARYDDIENRLESSIEYLRRNNYHGAAVEIFHSGMWLKVVYYRWKDQPRVL